MKKINQHTTRMKKVMVIMLALLTVPVVHALAQHGLGGEVGAPIDGGISLLVAAGVGYGVKKVRDARKKDIKPRMD